MDETTWQRWGAVSGLVAVATGAGAMLFERGGVSPDQPSAQITEFFSVNGSALLTQSLLFVVGAAALLWFIASLRAFLVEAEGGPGRLSSLVFGAGVAQVVINLMAQAFQIGLATAPADQVTGGLVALADATFVLANVPLAVMFAAVALVSLRHHAFPPWLSRLAGVVAAAYAVLSASVAADSGPLGPGGWMTYILYPMLVVWLIPASIVMIARGRRFSTRGGVEQGLREVGES